ncbi:conserved protein of unknown function [Legionella pneumophila subsp. pneumophila]|uniref:hypothetical protein n=1 Tax=Legionella pneumophila TaxID=446 RepID=UPI00026D987F|nr:hypothetical protein [Legionella pneumophila]CCD08975.1 conserved protein of unknown function [Legionella pneumophila subsp. pneumophila]
MRKNQLRQQVEQYCKHNHTASFRAKKHRHYVLHKMIRDLYHIGHVPPKWHGVTHDHMMQLVAHWKKERLKPKTIMKYMTIIRRFFQSIDHTIPDISNKHLRIKSANLRSKTIHFPNNSFETIKNPIAKILLEFQIYFGLTVSEAMRLNPAIHIHENSLWITRDIATNSHDRRIPVRYDMQAEINNSLQKLCKEQSLILTYGYHSVRGAYGHEMKKMGLPSSKSYRCFYAKDMYPKLSQVLSPYLAKQTIMREMGLQSRRTLWSYLHE